MRLFRPEFCVGVRGPKALPDCRLEATEVAVLLSFLSLTILLLSSAPNTAREVHS